VGFADAGEIESVFLTFAGAAVGVGGSPKFALDNIFEGGDGQADAEDLGLGGAGREGAIAVVDGDLDAKSAAGQNGVDSDIIGSVFRRGEAFQISEVGQRFGCDALELLGIALAQIPNNVPGRFGLGSDEPECGEVFGSGGQSSAHFGASLAPAFGIAEGRSGEEPVLQDQRRQLADCGAAQVLGLAKGGCGPELF
jgi:hypothetical protein